LRYNQAFSVFYSHKGTGKAQKNFADEVGLFKVFWGN